MKFILYIFLIVIVFTFTPVFARLGSKVNQNQKQFGNETISKQFSENGEDFSGKKVYQFPLFGWQVEAIYKDGRSISEACRPKGNKVKKKMISEQEANVIVDFLYPRKERGHYRKQVKNANFVSHFFENGLISYEMQLDGRRNKYIGVVGVRTVLYSDGAMFKDIMINAYH